MMTPVWTILTTLCAAAICGGAALWLIDRGAAALTVPLHDKDTQNDDPYTHDDE